MATIQEANELLANISQLNNKITQLQIRKQEKEKLIKEVLASVQATSYEDLEAKITACQAQLDTYYAVAKQQYDLVQPKVQEAEICLLS